MGIFYLHFLKFFSIILRFSTKKLILSSITYSLNGYLFISYHLILCKRRAFKTTDTELKAMAAPANQGAKNPNAAIGMPSEL